MKLRVRSPASSRSSEGMQYVYPLAWPPGQTATCTGHGAE